MKKMLIFAIMVVAIFATNISLAAVYHDRVATLDEEWQTKENGNVVKSDKKTTRLTIPNVAGHGEADRAAKKLEGKLLGTKDGKVKGAIPELSDKMDTATNAAQAAADKSNAVAQELAKVPGALQNQTTAIDSNTTAIKNSDNSNYRRTIWIIVGLAGIALIVLGLHFLRQRQEETRQRAEFEPVVRGLDDIQSAIGDLSTKIAQNHIETVTAVNAVPGKVKTLDLFTFSFTSHGHIITCTPSIKGNAFNSFCVSPRVKDEASNPSEIERVPIKSEGKIRRSTSYVMDDFFEGKFKGDDIHSRQQVELIRYAQAIGEMRIEKA